jgi:anion-transporting  ArsA/GET3 family ATPase
MRPQWVTRTRVAIVAGKGGVGSTTAAAAMAVSAARDGADVMLVAVDGRPGLGTMLGGVPLRPEATVLRVLPKGQGGGRIRGRTIPPSGAFSDYLELKGVNALIRRAASAVSLDVIAAATPGLEHLLVLGKIKELDRERVADLLIVDAPPAGHAAPFMRSPVALMEVITEGGVREQAEEVAAMLADHQRTQAIFVTLPEETPVNETVELAGDVAASLDLALGPVVVNAWRPVRPGLDRSASAAARAQGVKVSAADLRALEQSRAFGASQQRGAAEQLARLRAALPCPTVTLPRLPVTRIGPDELDVLADALEVEPEPAEEPGR